MIVLVAFLTFSQFSYAASAPNLVYNISFTPTTPNILKFGKNVTVRFSYDTNQAAGVRIFARPFSGAALTPNYAACPSGIYAAPTGTGSCSFTINSLNANVNRVRFQIYDATLTNLLYEIFVPVSFSFR